MPAATCAEIVLAAIQTAVEPLAPLAETPEVRVLRMMAADFEAEVRAWTPDSPDDDDREIMMKRVLALNVAVAKVVRGKSSIAP
jgi:predicted lysophospholipase L1 biosynthesis ABC-type transport system permease subunit